MIKSKGTVIRAIQPDRPRELRIQERSYSSAGRSSLGGSRLASSRVSVGEDSPVKDPLKSIPPNSPFRTLYDRYLKVDWASKFTLLYDKKLYH